MIISRTPLRISFVGGGTDIKKFYLHSKGAVLNTSIDKYIYVAVKRQLDFVDFKYRINWSKTEFRNTIDEIEHPIVREALKLFNIDFPVEITTFADVPAGTGLGSSSTFTVGLLHALYALKGQMVTKSELAKMAAHIEINILKRNIGKQDHYAASYGNLNVFTFHADETVTVEPVFYQPEIKNEIESRLLLFFTKKERDASKILRKQVDRIDEKFNTLTKMRDYIPSLSQVFSSGNNNLNEFGKILHESWILKKSITNEISSEEIDDYYQRAIDAGAVGGKLLGAGGGGFLLFYAEKIFHDNIREALKDLVEMKFKFEDAGTRITYYDQRQF
ncbi:MAG: GHMP kinase [Bacteroidales bacterium]|nr:GHMP kinase [Bacteroidales bacterium]